MTTNSGVFRNDGEDLDISISDPISHTALGGSDRNMSSLLSASASSSSSSSSDTILEVGDEVFGIVWNAVEAPIKENEIPCLAMVSGVIGRGLLWSILFLAIFTMMFYFVLCAFYASTDILIPRDQPYQFSFHSAEEEDKKGEATPSTKKKKKKQVNGFHKHCPPATLSSSESTRQRRRTKLSHRALVAVATVVDVHALVSTLGCVYLVCKNHWRVQAGHFENLVTNRRWTIFPFLRHDVPLVLEDTWIMDLSVGYFLYDLVFNICFDPSIMYLLHHIGYLVCAIPALIWDKAWMFMLYLTIPAEITNPLQNMYINSRSVGIKSVERQLGPHFVVFYTICRLIVAPLVVADVVLFVVEDVYHNREGQWTPLDFVRLWSCLMCTLGIIGSIMWFDTHARQYLFPMLRQSTRAATTTALKTKTV